MLTVMITGGLGSGKSTLRELLCEKGAISLDLDAIAGTLLESDAQMIGELADEFGPEILDDEGAIIRSRLAEYAFASPQDTQRLNAITFPHITEAATEYVLNVHCTPRTNAKVLVVEVPLLTEVPEFAALADQVISVEVPVAQRLARAVERGMDPQDALNRLNIQPTDEERSALATAICPNRGSLEELRSWVDAWWKENVDEKAADA